MIITCPECKRKFDIYNSETDAAEYFDGHDCEETETD